MPRLWGATPLGRRLLGAALAAAAILGGAAARAEEAVVVASTAPGYGLGQVIPDGATVTLPDGANALFLFSDGRMVRQEGPFEGRIGGVPQVAVRGAGELVGGERFFQTDLGASRSLGPWPVGKDELLLLDPGSTGTVCVPAGSQPRLRRPADPALSAVSLRDGATGSSARLSWPERAAGKGVSLPWPRRLALRDGAEFIVAGPDGKPRHALRLRVLPAAAEGADAGGGAPSAAALALEMARAGCRTQAAALLSPLRDAMAPLNLYLATDKGLYPTYRPGDPVRMVLQTNRDAYVYCYLRNRRGLTPIFPPGAAASPLVEGHVPLTFPGERMPLVLQAGQPSGDQEVRCFATGRDLGDGLPGRREAYRPLTPEAMEQLDQALGSLRGTDLVMAQVVLRVD